MLGNEIVKSIESMKYDKKLTLTVKEASELTGIGMNKMYELMHQKGAPTIIVGRKIIIVKAKFIEWIENSIGSKF